MYISTRNIEQVLFNTIVILIGVEHIGYIGISVFKVIIFPLCILGIIVRLLSGTNKKGLVLYLPLFFLISLILLTGVFNTESRLIKLSLGLYGFTLFIFLYVLRYGLANKFYISLSLYTVPHYVIAFLSSIGVLSNVLVYSGVIPRFGGIEGEPNFLGAWAVVGLIGKIALLVNNSKEGYWAYRLLALLVVLDILIILSTVSRASIIAMLYVLALWFCYTYNKYSLNLKSVGYFLATAIAIYSLTILMAYVYTNPLDLVFSRFEVGIAYREFLNDRFVYWVSALEHSLREGVIVGTTPSEFVNRAGIYSHNTFIEGLLSMGLVGTIMFIIYIFISVVVSTMSLDPWDQMAWIFATGLWVNLLGLSSFSTKLFWLSVVVVAGLSARQLIR